MANSWRLSDSENIELASLRTDLNRFFKHRTNFEAVDNLTTDTIIAVGACFEHRSTLRHFVFAVARNKLSDWYRGRRRRVPVEQDTAIEELSDSGPGLESLLSLPARHAVLQRALAQIPECHREVVELWLAGHDNVHIAVTLDINYNTARSRLLRGKRALIERFTAELGETE